MHIVADLRHLAITYSSYTMPICSLGIMGTEYVRNEAPPTDITLEQGSTTALNIPHIYSALPIGNTLQINMRQQSGAELSFVSLSNLASLTKVKIDGSNLTNLGDYELVLESFDEANTVQSTLKTDRILISVVSAV